MKPGDQVWYGDDTWTLVEQVENHEDGWYIERPSRVGKSFYRIWAQTRFFIPYHPEGHSETFS